MSASNQLPVSPGTRWGALALNFRSTLLTLMSQAKELQAKAAAVQSNGNIADMATQFGCPAGKEQALFDEIDSCTGTILNNGSISGLVDNINQFIAFIG